MDYYRAKSEYFSKNAFESKQDGEIYAFKTYLFTREVKIPVAFANRVTEGRAHQQSQDEETEHCHFLRVRGGRKNSLTSKKAVQDRRLRGDFKPERSVIQLIESRKDDH